MKATKAAIRCALCARHDNGRCMVFGSSVPPQGRCFRFLFAFPVAAAVLGPLGLAAATLFVTGN